MAASDATPFPIKNQAYRVTFPILDADGDLVTGAAGLDSETSADGGTFADCTNEATEIATNSGVYYLDLTSGEMNADTVAVIVKTSTSGAKTTTLILYPITNGLDIPVNATYIGGQAVTASGGITFPAATLASTTNITAGTITTATNLTNAPGAGDFTATMKTSIGTAVAASAVASVTVNVGGNVVGTVASVVGAVGSVAGLTASDVGAIKAKTDSLNFTVAGNVNANIQYVNDVAITGDGQSGTEWGP